MDCVSFSGFMGKLKGVIVAMLTPFKDNYELNVEALRDFTEWLVGCGVHGLFPCGSIGEAPKMSMEERKLVMKTVVDSAPSDVPVIPGAGFPDHVRTIELLKYAKDVGCAGALVVPPYYCAPSEETLLDYYKTVAEAVPDLPLVLYNIPQFVGYRLTPSLLSRCAEVPNIVGLKDSGGDFMTFNQLINTLGDKFIVLQGFDSLLYPSLLVGSPGGFVGGASVAAKLEVEMYNAFVAGNLDKAREIHDKLLKLWRILSYGTFPTPFKEAATMVSGVPMGPPRKPALQLSQKDKEELRRVLEEIGLLG